MVIELFDELADMGHERVLFCSNPDVGLRAIVAIHSTVLGPGLGGCRMWPFASVEEALIDVLRLSRGMTYKAAAAGLNLGGAKAVILGDPKRDKSEVLFRSFGRYVDTLGGAYITAEDVGTDMDDMELILTETSWVTGVSPSHGGSGDPSPVTAYGVLRGIEAAAEWHFGDRSLTGKSVAIQGLGSVGLHLAEYLAEEGVKVFGCDIDEEATAEAENDVGVEIVPVEEIFDVDCDVFAPCALGASLNDETIPRLRCKIVAGGANNQLASEDRHGNALSERGILYAPDFVINAGGLINVYNEFVGGYNRERALRMTRGIYLNLSRVFEISRDESIPTHVAADRLAEERIAAVKRLGSRHWGRLIGKRRLDG
ncbi:MAG: Glu/Leu/Phe/Val dehydrogenase dimerization domain-containing protein [Thermoanaerobaculia bacterium]|nr:Glu/Leu/Phe/Val dehydrogenase dimerization domain-containing protein [Thermoanaerobaculia bacterium]